MKRPIVAFAVLLGSLALNAQAEGFFVGGDIAPFVNWQARSEDCFFNCSPYHSEQNSTSTGFGIHGGQWVWSGHGGMVGWEVGHDSLGSINGSTTATSALGLTLGTGRWKYTAAAQHVAMLVEGMKGKNMLLGKIGIYRSSTKAEGSYVLGPGTYSNRTTGAGLFLGVGYKYAFSAHLSWIAALDGFVNVKVTDPANPSTTTSENLLKVSFGADYNF